MLTSNSDMALVNGFSKDVNLVKLFVGQGVEGVSHVPLAGAVWTGVWPGGG